jgi:hypothetical protein
MSQDNQTLVPEAPKASRRGLLLGLMAGGPAAALAAGTVADALANGMAKAGEVDPIYEAIKHERDIYAEYCATDAIQSRIGDEDPCPLKIRQGRPPSDRSIAKRLARSDVQAWLVRYCES